MEEHDPTQSASITAGDAPAPDDDAASEKSGYQGRRPQLARGAGRGRGGPAPPESATPRRAPPGARGQPTAKSTAAIKALPVPGAPPQWGRPPVPPRASPKITQGGSRKRALASRLGNQGPVSAPKPARQRGALRLANPARGPRGGFERSSTAADLREALALIRQRRAEQQLANADNEEPAPPAPENGQGNADADQAGPDLPPDHADILDQDEDQGMIDDEVEDPWLDSDGEPIDHEPDPELARAPDRGIPGPDAMPMSTVNRIGAAGGIVSLAEKGQRRLQGRAPSTAELRKVPEAAIITLFGSARTGVIRIDNSISVTAITEFTKRRTASRLLAADGSAVPTSFSKRPVFFHFQLDHFELLHASPLDLTKAEEWFYGFSRWATHDPCDISKGSEFAHLLHRTEILLQACVAAEAQLAAAPGSSLKAALRTDAEQLILAFSNVRTRHVTDLVVAARPLTLTAAYRPHFEVILRAFQHLNTVLPTLLHAVFGQISAQSSVKGNDIQREEYVSRAHIAMYRAFIAGIKNAPFLASGLATATLPSGPAATPAFSNAPTTVWPYSANPVPTPAVSVGFSTGAGSAHGTPASTVVNTVMHAPTGAPSLDCMARQVVHGFRMPGPYAGPGGSSGSTDGIDLTEESRRLLQAYQIKGGIRHPGTLILAPPAGELPPLPPFYAAYSTQQLPAPAPPPAPSFAPPATMGPYGIPGPAGARSRARAMGTSDELHIPFSTGMLGSYSPYRKARLPDQCFECNAVSDHFANECPARFLRVRGELPPGWKKDGLAVIRDTAKWIGLDLTETARIEMRAFAGTHALTPHQYFPVQLDEISAPQPVAARNPLRRQP